MKEEEEGKKECPVCGKEVLGIEAHVEKCLFLNSASEPPYQKRLLDQPSSDSQPTKKHKPSSPAPHKGNGGGGDKGRPLADLMRPVELSGFFGQDHLLGQDSLLRSLINQCNIPSMILWGPPGCGKTTLAQIIKKKCDDKKDQYRFAQLSATMAGVNEVKEIVKVARNEMNMFKRKTILFMDEIHRFNKMQQDIFLSHCESGLITLVGATTENPSFSINSALLSRCRVFVLEKLKKAHITAILINASKTIDVDIINNNNQNLNPNSKYSVELETLEWLARMSDGDARIALNSLQMAVDSLQSDSAVFPLSLTLHHVREGIKKSHLLYDRKGEEHYNIISALHKSIRASDENASLYWLARMLQGGEDPLFIARRLVRAASEDIGLMDSTALSMAVSGMQACQLLGMPECDVILAHVTTYLARSMKSREMDDAYSKAKELVNKQAGRLPPVPLHLRNATTKLNSQLGYGKGYNMRHRSESMLSYLPQGMEGVRFFPEEEVSMSPQQRLEEEEEREGEGELGPMSSQQEVGPGPLEEAYYPPTSNSPPPPSTSAEPPDTPFVKIRLPFFPSTPSQS